MNTKSWAIGMVAAALLVLGACSSQKEPATAAVTAAENALAAIKADAAIFLPDELKGVESSLASLKDTLARSDYTAVLANAPALTGGLDALKSSLAAKLELNRAAATEWGGYATDVPKAIEALQGRVDTLSAAKRLPRGMDATKLAALTGELESLKAQWVEASASYDNGNAIDAVATVKAAKIKSEELLKQLGIRTG